MRIVALLVLAGCEDKTLGFGSPLPPDVPRFAVACSTAPDCVVVPAENPCGCGCGERAISAAAEQDFYRWYFEEQTTCPPIVCPDCDPSAAAAACVEGQCVIDAPGGDPGGSGGLVGRY